MNPTGAAFKNGAHKAYLPYKNSAGAKGFVGFDTTTSINDEPYFDTTIDDQSIIYQGSELIKIIGNRYHQWQEIFKEINH